jgi:hypothetical protein
MKRKTKISFTLLLSVFMMVFASISAYAAEVPTSKYTYSLTGEVGTQSTKIDIEEDSENGQFLDLLAKQNYKIVLVKEGAEIKFTPKEKMSAVVNYYTVDGSYGGALFWTIDGSEEAVSEIEANKTATTTLHKKYGGYTGGLYFVFSFGKGSEKTDVIYWVSDGSAAAETTSQENDAVSGASTTEATPSSTPSSTPAATPTAPKTVQPATVNATPSVSKVLVDGKQVPFEAYTINNNTYFKLRDIAMAVKGTDKGFEVGYSNEHKAISLISLEAYTPQGGELAVSSKPKAKKATLSTSKVYVDDEEMNFTAYTIGGNNYFKLRDIADAFGMKITFDSKTNTVGIVTTE